MDNQHIICPFCGLPEATADDSATCEAEFFKSNAQGTAFEKRFCWAELDDEWCEVEHAAWRQGGPYAVLRTTLIEMRTLKAQLAQLTAKQTTHAPEVP